MRTIIEIEEFAFASIRFYTGELKLQHQDEVHNYPFMITLKLRSETVLDSGYISDVTFTEDTPDNEEFYIEQIKEKFFNP